MAGMLDDQRAVVFNHLANLNMPEEEQTVFGRQNIREPSLGRKVVIFVTLLVATLHPAIWNRRRAVLRQREGRVRTEMNALEAGGGAVDGEESEEVKAQKEAREARRREISAVHAMRPKWVRDYMDRVMAEDWVDDSD